MKLAERLTNSPAYRRAQCFGAWATDILLARWKAVRLAQFCRTV